MKNLTCFTLSFLLLLALLQCKPKEDFIPEEDNSPVDTTEVAMWMNGKLVSYFPRFRSYPGTGVVTLTLMHSKGIFINFFGVSSPVALLPGEYGRYLSFGQYRNLDHGNQSYDQIDVSDAKFTLQSIDTATKQTTGYFKAKFKRRGAAGIVNQDSYLPEEILFEGRFHTKYTEF